MSFQPDGPEWDLLLKNARRTGHQVEVFMATAAVLLFFQLIFGSIRRRTSNLAIHGALWVAYALLPPLITYTLGLMQSSEARITIYPVWALCLFLIAGGANSITAYDLDDNKQWKRRLFDILQYDIFFCIILFRLLFPSDGCPKSLMFPLIFLSHRPAIVAVFFLLACVLVAPTFGVVASWITNYSNTSKVVADYMKDHACTCSQQGQELDPLTMKGCRYMVCWPWPGHKVVPRGTSSSYRCEVPDEASVVTVEMIWNMCNNQGNNFGRSDGVISSRMKGACLSYALSHLLRRRFFGMDCAEASLGETRRFVLEGLLSEGNRDEYTQGFRVIEVELAFLYDFFYTKYAIIFGMERLFFIMAIVKIVCSFALAVLLLFKSAVLHTRHGRDYYYQCSDDNPKIELHMRLADAIMTLVILGTFFTVEALQSILYLGSDWAMVSLACSYVKGSSYGFIPLCLRKRFRFLTSGKRHPLFSYWQNKLGQYSVIQGSQFFVPRKDFAFQSDGMAKFLLLKLFSYVTRTCGNLFSSKGFHFVELPDLLKPEIISLLKSNRDGHLTNGTASLQSNGGDLTGYLLRTLRNETQTENMLIWHIATDYCRIRLCDEQAEVTVGQDSSSYQNVKLATTLSRYCAYLMSRVPELLPGNSVDTKFVLEQVICEARETLGCKERNREVLLDAVKDRRAEDTAGSIFIKGLELGAKLEEMGDSSQRWKLMADFWVETLLYIAPSDNTKAHMERLAQGGEFLTHLWALLTHAGILTRSQVPLRQ